MSGNGFILRLDMVAKSFREPTGLLQVLNGVVLNVRPGETVLVQGPSGSGKTTLLQVAGCLLRADAGTVEIGGREVNSGGDAERTEVRQRQLGFVFQHFHLIDALTVRENTMLGLRLKRQAPDGQRVDEVLGLLGLAGKARKLPRDLSGGEKQRVAFARALVGRPSLLLADEPTSQLDSHAAETVAGQIRQSVREFGCAAIIATHDARLHAVADRICTTREGRLYE